MGYYTESFSAEEVLEYLRKSRSDDPALTVEEVLEKHEKILNDYAERHFGSLVPTAQVYREIASSETIDGRPEMLRLLKAVESPRIKAVLVVEVQRLSRGDLEDAGRLIKLLRYTNTKVITPTKTYNLQDEYDRDIFERELKRGNEYLEYYKKIQARGRLESVREGNFLGSHPPYGYDKIFITVGKKKCPTLQENKAQADVMRMIFDLYVNHDMGYQRICNRLDELGISSPSGASHWSPAGLKDMLQNEHYVGKVRWNWRKTTPVVEGQEIIYTRPKSTDYEVYEGRHEGIISEELFRAAQAKQGRNYRAKAKTKIRNPLSGILYCQCGRAMSYRTYSSSAPRLLCDGQTRCHNGSASYSEVVDRVCRILRENIAAFEIKLQESHNENNAVRLHNNLIKNLEKQLKDLEAKEISQWEAQADPDPANRMPQHVFRILNEKLLKEKADVQHSLQAALESTPPESVNYAQKLVLLKEALETVENPDAPAELKSKYLKAVFDRLEYHREKPIRVTREEAIKRGMNVENGNHILWYSPEFELKAELRL